MTSLFIFIILSLVSLAKTTVTRTALSNTCEHYLSRDSAKGTTEVTACVQGELFSRSTGKCVGVDSLGEGERKACDIRDETCGQLDSVDPADCSRYHRCVLGRRYVAQCGGNLVFSNTVRKCVASLGVGDHGTCVVGPFTVDRVCKLTGSAKKISYSPSCRMYYDCGEAQNKLKQCPNGQYFRVESEECTALGRLSAEAQKRCASEVEAAKDNSKCLNGFVGVIRKEGSCYAGYECTEAGKPTELTCAPPTVIHPEKPVCVTLDTLAGSGDMGTLDYYTRCSGGGQPPPQKKCNANPFDVYITDNLDCNAYYHCTMDYETFAGKLTQHKCATGQVYDDHPAITRCVAPANHTAPDRCLVAPNSAPECPHAATGFKRIDCTTYRRCRLGKLSTVTCQKDHFFTTQGGGKCVAFDGLTNVEKSGVCSKHGKVVVPVTNPECSDPSIALTTLPHKTDCRKYHVCQSGVISLVTCPGGFIYVAETGTCVLVGKVDFGRCDIALRECTGSWKSENNCKVYYTCNGAVKCPDGQVYLADNTQCKIPTKQESDACNKLAARGQFAKKCPSRGTVRMLDLSDTSCASYYQCIDGTPTPSITCSQLSGRRFATAGWVGAACVSVAPIAQGVLCE